MAQRFRRNPAFRSEISAENFRLKQIFGGKVLIIIARLCDASQCNMRFLLLSKTK
jgi:hypothetical protein